MCGAIVELGLGVDKALYVMLRLLYVDLFGLDLLTYALQPLGSREGIISANGSAWRGSCCSPVGEAVDPLLLAACRHFPDVLLRTASSRLTSSDL